MNITYHHAANWLRSLEPAQRALFLAELCHQMTVATRFVLSAGGEGDDVIRRARHLNEALHKIAGYMTHVHAGDEDVEWIRVVLLALESDDWLVQSRVAAAWSRAKQHSLR